MREINLKLSWGLDFDDHVRTWREEDPTTKKILEFGTTFRLVLMQKFGQGGYQVEKENN